MKVQEIDSALARLAGKKTAARSTARKRRRRRERKPRLKGEPVKQKLALPAWQVLCVRMAPDTWYEGVQLVALLPEYGGRKFVMADLLEQGLIERAGHPDFDPAARPTVGPRPRYVFRLTATGARKAAEWRAWLDLVGDTGQA